MKPFRAALAALALCTALPAAAVPTTYGFGGSPASVTNPSAGSNATTAANGTTTFKNGNVSQYGNNGTNYGNTLTWNGSTSGSSVTVSAWSNTNNGKFEKAYVGNYGGDFGITSQTVAGNTELNGGNQPNTANHQHAIDNVGSYEALLFSFQSAVTLSNVSLGFPSASSGLDSDATILYWAGTGDPTPALSARTLADLTTNGWAVATNIGNMAVGGNATNLSSSIASKYWLVGAYANLGGPNQGGALSAGNDYIKVNGITTTPRVVPEPDTLALFGIAAVALLARRRRVRNA